MAPKHKADADDDDCVITSVQQRPKRLPPSSSMEFARTAECRRADEVTLKALLATLAGTSDLVDKRIVPHPEPHRLVPANFPAPNYPTAFTRQFFADRLVPPGKNPLLWDSTVHHAAFFGLKLGRKDWLNESDLRSVGELISLEHPEGAFLVDHGVVVRSGGWQDPKDLAESPQFRIETERPRVIFFICSLYAGKDQMQEPNHWALAVHHVQERYILYLDSLKGEGHAERGQYALASIASLWNALDNAYTSTHPRPIRIKTTRYPTQKDGWSCGFWVSLHMLYMVYQQARWLLMTRSPLTDEATIEGFQGMADDFAGCVGLALGKTPDETIEDIISTVKIQDQYKNHGALAKSIRDSTSDHQRYVFFAAGEERYVLSTVMKKTQPSRSSRPQPERSVDQLKPEDSISNVGSTGGPSQRPVRPDKHKQVSTGPTYEYKPGTRYEDVLDLHRGERRVPITQLKERIRAFRDGELRTPYVWKGDTYKAVASRPYMHFPTGWKGWDDLEHRMEAVDRANRGLGDGRKDDRERTARQRGQSEDLVELGKGGLNFKGLKDSKK